MTDARTLVAEAAEFFDLYWPADELGVTWYDAVDLAKLNMDDGCLCVCGQLGSLLAEHEGYPVHSTALDGYRPTVRLGETVNDDIGGYTLMMSVPQSIRDTIDQVRESKAFFEAELELVEKMTKRLGQEHRMIPLALTNAFAGTVPNSYWVEEILARRGREA